VSTRRTRAEGERQLPGRNELEGVGEELVELAASQASLVSVDFDQDGGRAFGAAVNLDA